MPATLSIISNTFPREERGKAIGIWAGMSSVGIGLGPLMGGLLLEWFDWSSVFLLNVPIVAIAFVLGFRWVSDSRDPEPGRFDIPGALLSIGALGTLVYGVIEAPNRGWTDSLILGSFGVALVLGLAFVKWELRTREPMLNLSFFRNPRFSAASGAISLASFALFGAMFALTQFMQDVHGYSALEAGAAMTPLAAGLVAGALASVKLVERFGTTRVVVAGLAGLGGLLMIALTWSPDMPYVPLGLWFFGGALTMGLTMGPATESVMGAVPEEKAGVASAMNDVTRQVAGALGTAVIGSLITSLYASRVHDAAATLPEASRAAAKDSVGKANAIAAHLPVSEGAQLMHSAGPAFTDALGIGFAVAGAVALLSAAAVKCWLPAKHLESRSDGVSLPARAALEPAA